MIENAIKRIKNWILPGVQGLKMLRRIKNFENIKNRKDVKKEQLIFPIMLGLKTPIQD